MEVYIMSDLMILLFDHYTAQCPEVKQKAYTEHEKFSLLKALVGEEQAVEIWDAATGEGAGDCDHCFTAGVKAGFTLAVELFTASAQ